MSTSPHSCHSPARSDRATRPGSPITISSRHEATIRLGSPVPFPMHPTGSPIAVSYLQGEGGAVTPPRYGTPSRFDTPVRFLTPPRGTTPIQIGTPQHAAASQNQSTAASLYGSFDAKTPREIPEIVKRHLVTEEDAGIRRGRTRPGDEGFSSLQLQGGDITRPIYRYVEEAEASQRRRARSQSFHVTPRDPEDPALNISKIKAPGGFRRNYLRIRAGISPTGEADGSQEPRWLADNFIEFLSLYGHFAGEELEEEEEGAEWSPGESPFRGAEEARRRSYAQEEGELPQETSTLLQRKGRRRSRSIHHVKGTTSAWSAVLLLLKSFVGTGVLFLPKAYSNGGMLFSNVLLLLTALLSYYCFVLLVKTRTIVDGGFGEIGGKLYGPKLRFAILFSIVISQIGFASAYIVFTSENLQAFIRAVTNDHRLIDIKWLIMAQFTIFLPLSMVRNINKLGGTALVADLFILLGLIYLYYYNFFTIGSQGIADIVNFNPRSWTLFIGTAVFTFEGIGLIIPIQESMKHPEKFPMVLAGVMIVITVIFTSMGALSYAAYGSKIQTVVILNLPQDNKFVNGVQFLYSLAILLSTPLQLFPAIRIMENGLFTRSGKYEPSIKWQKNIFRFFTVFLTAFISWGGADDLDKFVALIGSFACIPLIYMYPPLLHLKAVASTPLAKASDIALFLFGSAVMVYTTVLTINSWATK